MQGATIATKMTTEQHSVLMTQMTRKKKSPAHKEPKRMFPMLKMMKGVVMNSMSFSTKPPHCTNMKESYVIIDAGSSVNSFSSESLVTDIRKSSKA